MRDIDLTCDASHPSPFMVIERQRDGVYVTRVIVACWVDGSCVVCTSMRRTSTGPVTSFVSHRHGRIFRGRVKDFSDVPQALSRWCRKFSGMVEAELEWRHEEQ